MLLNRSAEINVFEISNSKFEALGEINRYTAISWPEVFDGCGEFELWCPITEENKQLIKVGNVLWCGEENAGVIEIIKSEVDKDGLMTYDVKGKTLERYLFDRIIWGTLAMNGRPSTIMYAMVNQNCVNPSNSNRKIPYLICYQDELFGSVIQYQKTGGTVYDALQELAKKSNLGFNIIFDIKNQKLVFKVLQGKDRSVGNTQGNDAIELSTDLSDILESEYYINIEDEKNVAFVQGEDSGGNRKNVTSGLIYSSGYNRKELYVDARDIQSEVYGEDGESRVIPEQEYLGMLDTRGQEKLAENVISETFSAVIRQFGTVQYRYGIDYFKGDTVTVTDDNLSVSVNAVVTKVEHQYDDEYNMDITFGFMYPTIVQRVKKMVG